MRRVHLPHVEIQDRSILVDGVRASLVSGEVHYWRITPDALARVLGEAKTLGFETLSSYVPWQFHQVSPGAYDFSGSTVRARDLIGYLEAVAQAGFKLAIRPGPYIFGEWDNYGIPDELVPYHRLDPRFKEAASEYIARLCEVLKPFLATRGGPIIMLQADNMFDLGKDRYDRMLGLLGGQGIFQDYIRGLYPNIEMLNSTWNTDYVDHSAAMATTGFGEDAPHMRRRYLDYLTFRDWYTEECARWTVEQYRQADVDVPIYSNTTRDQAPHQMRRHLDFLSINFYPTESYLLDGEHRRLLDDVRVVSSISQIPYVGELHSGTWHGYHYDKGTFRASDAEFSVCNILAGGAAGWNWYMLHDRDNWYMSPLNSSGRQRHELTAVVRKCIKATKEAEPWTWKRLTRTAITHVQLHHAMQHRKTDDQTTARASGKALYDAGIDYTFYSLDGPPEDKPDLLIYDGDDWLERTQCESLVNYVEAGGHLVLFQTVPRFDEKGQQVDILEVPYPDAVMTQGYMNTFHRDAILDIGGTELRTPVPRSIHIYAEPPGKRIVGRLTPSTHTLNDNVLDEYKSLVSLGSEDQLTMGFTDYRGSGSITIVGLPPSPELIFALHRHLGVGLAAAPSEFGLQVALFRAHDRYYLIALNNNQSPVSSDVNLDLDRQDSDQVQVDLLLGSAATISQRRASTLTVTLGPKSGALIQLTYT
jgi:beta-galactosidase GanA